MCFIALGPALQRPELFLSFLTSADALPLEPKICTYRSRPRRGRCFGPYAIAAASEC